MLICTILIAIVLLSSCNQYPNIIFLPGNPGLIDNDPNTSTSANPYTPADTSELQSLLDMDTSTPIYIEIPDETSIQITENSSLTIPSGKDVRMTINGTLDISGNYASSSLAKSNTAVQRNTVSAENYALVEKEFTIDKEGTTKKGYVPDTDTILITVESGASLILSGEGRIGGTLNTNPSRNLICVENGGELTINGNLTFVSFPYYTDSEITNSTIYSDGILTINGGNFYSTYRTIFADENSTLTIKDGIFVSVASNALLTGYAYAVTGAGTTDITGGKYYGLQGALAQNGGRGEINGVETRATTSLFSKYLTDPDITDADIKEELSDFYNLNAKTDGHTSDNIGAGEVWHGLYLAGEEGEINKIVVSGGEYYTNGSSGRGIYVGNSNDGGLGLPTAVEITNGSFYSEQQDTVFCDPGKEQNGITYGQGNLKISGGSFGSGSGKSHGIREEDLAEGYKVSETTDASGYYTIEPITT